MFVSVRNLEKSYGNKSVLKNINIEIKNPEIVALVGPNGSGKTTLLKALVNQVDIDSGIIELCEINNQNIEVFNKVSFLSDNTVLYPYLSGIDHLSYAAGIYKIGKDHIHKVIQMTQISEFVKNKVCTYSLGMKQQLLIALSLLNDPKLIIMDEPLNGLDPSRIIFFRQLWLDLAKSGKAILMSSHTLSEVDMVTSHILFLKEGRIIEEHLNNNNMSSEDRYKEIFRL